MLTPCEVCGARSGEQKCVGELPTLSCEQKHAFLNPAHFNALQSQLVFPMLAKGTTAGNYHYYI